MPTPKNYFDLQLELPDFSSIYTEKAKEIQAAIDKLQHLQQQTLFLAFFEGLTHVEISEYLGTPLGSVKPHIRAGLLRLRNLLSSMSKSEITQSQSFGSQTLISL